MKIRPVILSGGSGTRLWPISRRCFPKQFANLVGEESLFIAALRATQDRMLFEAPLIVGNVDHKFLILDALQTLGIIDAKILLEPTGRNTGAAAIVAALSDEDGELLHLVMPSDHVITNKEAFLAAIHAAKSAAQDGKIVLFGIQPTHPEIGYGYIIPGENTLCSNVFFIKTFREKPDAHTASHLIAAGGLWNAGIFFYAPKTVIEEAKLFAPEYFVHCRTSLIEAHQDLGCTLLAKDPYEQIKSEPFDRLIMEKTQRGCVVPCSIGWSDAGSWQALWQMKDGNSDGNVFSGPAILEDVTNGYIHSNGPLVTVLGMQDVVVIATHDAVLVTPRERAQDVRMLVAKLEKISPQHTEHHAKVLRPWGTYESLAAGQNFQVKHIIVQPGKSLSLQKHHHRAEHWVVVVGTAKVERDGVVETVFPNQSVYVSRGSIHRLSNPGKIPLHLIEVQSGDYLGEDDIVRLDDPYGREVGDLLSKK